MLLFVLLDFFMYVSHLPPSSSLQDMVTKYQKRKNKMWGVQVWTYVNIFEFSFALTGRWCSIQAVIFEKWNAE